jgi:AraC family transcriptional regulator
MIEPPAKGAIDVEAALAAPGAKIQLVHYHFAEPPASMLHGGSHFRVELCLTARHRSSRGSFRDYWSPHRYERIGDLFVVPPDLDLVARSDDDASLTSIVCEYDREPILALFETLPVLTDQLLAASLDVRDMNLRHLLLRLAEEVKHPGFASGMMAELITREMAIELVRHGAAVTDDQKHGGLASWQLRRIDERLAEERDAPALAELAQLCRISIRHLMRGFRSSRGCSIGSYVACSQIDHAKRLLAAGESVTAIASVLGFSSSSNFCSAFRRTTGMAPGAFQRTLLRH